MKIQKPKRRYEMKVFWSEEDKEWIAVAPELPGCSASSAAPDEALKELETAMDLWLESRAALGRSLPRPIAERELQGRILLRLPKALHRELLESAVEQGVSLNQYLLYALSRGQRGVRPKPA